MKKLENKIHIYELDCYKNATEEQKKKMRVRKERYFDLEGLPSEAVRKLLEDFVWERGKELAPSSLASEILYFNNIRHFLIKKNIKTLRYEDENKIILQLKSWMMEQGYALTSKKYRSVYEIVATETPGIVKHMKKILRYSQKDEEYLEQDRDVWELDKFEFPLRSNPIKNVKTINFKGISQITIRKEVKTVVFMVQEEMRGYRSYLDADGARRQEVKKTEETAHGNEEVVAEAVRKGKEIQDYIDDWEPDDEDDELDEEALWAPVLTITAGFQKDGRFRVPAVRDKKKMNVLEAVSRLSGTDLLSLCVPAGTVISENWISTAAFPSALYAGGESGKRGTAGDVWTAGLERALLDAYAAHFFTRFGQEKTGSVHYEQEYLLQGNASERENLKRTVNELLAVREAVNLAALYADSEKRSEAEALALAITGLAGITPITAAASFFIMTVWAFAESVADVKVLLAGGKIPFFKQPGEWQISLSALTEKGASIFLETGTDPSLKNGTDDRGLDYQDWLKLFFLIQGKSRFCYRMMDMIQNRISEKEPGFRMDQCQYGVSVSYAAQGTLIPLRRTSQKEY